MGKQANYGDHGSTVVIKIIKILINCKINEVVTFKQMCKATGMPIINGGTYELCTARDLLETQEGMVFKNIPTQGYRLLENKEKNQHFIDRFLKRTKSNSRRTKKKLVDTVEFTSLSRSDKNRYIVTMLQASEIEIFVSEPSRAVLLKKNYKLEEVGKLNLMKAASNIF